MRFKLIGHHLLPADGEVVVRTYHCTSLSPAFALIGLKTDGYLTVTNKRVVYFAHGLSLFGIAGKSQLYNDVPIADVAYISLRKGTRFSVLRLLCGLLFGHIPAAIVTLILLEVMSVLGKAGSGDNPYLQRLGVFFQLSAVVLLVLRSLSVSRENIVRFMLASSGLALLSPGIAAHWGALQRIPSIYARGMMMVGIPLGCYAVWCLYWFIRREYLTMTISSKSGYSNPIRIFGVSWWGRINVAADFASGMAPAVDADAMFKELGAMVTDIQTLGDHGIKKWLQVEPESGAVDANRHRPDFDRQKVRTRYALATIMVVGLFVGMESMWYASGASKALALQTRSEMADARKAVGIDPSIRQLVPKMLASAEQEAAAGEAAFQRKNLTDAMVHWRAAIGVYTNISSAAAALKDAVALQSQYKTGMKSTYLQETASERLKTAILMKDFTSLMSQHPRSNRVWISTSQSKEEAKGLGEQEKWEQSATAWDSAASDLPTALQLMRADLWVELAQSEIKKENPSAATNYADNALQELPRYAPALQRQKLAMNMIIYNWWLRDEISEGRVSASDLAEFMKRLDLTGGGDWTAIKGSVEKAKTLANQEEWVKCNDEWENALNKMARLMLLMHMERLEAEARKGNWRTVYILASKVLMEHPDHSRATELKKKAEAIESARVAESAYRQTLTSALEREIAVEHVKIGDMTDFVAQMDRYGHEEWIQVKEAVSKAEKFTANEQGTEGSIEWKKASSLFALAVQRMHAEMWLEQAEMEAKNGNWAKVLVYAERALKEKPDHVRAKQLRDQADGIEEKLPTHTK